MAAAHREIVRVVRGRDFDESRAEVLYDLVLNERRLAPDQGQCRALAGESAIAFVFRVECDGRVSEHRFGARRRHDNEVAVRRFEPSRKFSLSRISLGQTFDTVRDRMSDRIGDVIELALDLLHHDLEVGDGGLQPGRPVDQVFAAVDQPFVVESHEDFLDRVRDPRPS